MPRSFYFRTERLGIAAFALAFGCFFIGRLRGEIVLLLASFMLFVPLVYAVCGVLFLAMLHRRRAKAVVASIAPETAAPGSTVSLVISTREDTLFKQLPAILIRYKLKLSTRDKKIFTRVFSREFWKKREEPFSVPPRGAYFGRFDEIVIRDIFGFFRAGFRLSFGDGIRLKVPPVLLTRRTRLKLSYGGERRAELERVKSDELLEQRQYIPGDDPRRINWKLYGHAGELFVREEEREPPQASELALFLCTEAPAELFKTPLFYDGVPVSAAAACIDMLCETALGIAADCAEVGVVCGIGASGISLSEVYAARDAAQALALPWAIPAGEAYARLPDISAGHVTILALPSFSRAGGFVKGALAEFLSRNGRARSTVLFVYRDAEDAEAASGSARLAARYYGVDAYAIKV
ncbi:MAG: DUF58 domain-containing protein [Spirochaetaceae bacterium]|jgi:uncharacterized protein (DUF58 family)|nr:DUF58 domain-containing protein [Spirochaetaceae bacterium]